MMTPNSGIYAIRNKHNDKRYIGSSLFLNKRLTQHKSDLMRGGHRNIRLQRAWNKYSVDSFVFEIIEYVEGKDSLVTREQHWIDFYMSATDCGYNIKPIAYSNYGYVFSQEARNKMSLAQIGRKHSKETRDKIGAAHIGRKYGDATRARMSDARRNITVETRAKMSSYASNRSTDHTRKISATLSARKPSEKTLLILLAAAKRPKSDETKARMSIAAKARCARQAAKLSEVNHGI